MAKGRIEQEIFIKIVNGKDVGELQKAIKQLEKTKAELTVTADTDDARKELDEIDKQLAELRGEKAEIEVTAKVDRAIAAIEEVATEAKQAEAAAEALSVALGPELAAKADLDGIISDFQRMGLSMDEITANADRLGATLRDVGQKDIGGRLTTGFNRMDGTIRSAGGSASVFANAIGNASQDLGAVAGLSGTAGVAIGQMGEYMADARLQGEGLRSVLANFGRIAGPVAVLVAAVQAVSSVMAAHKQAAEESAAASEQLGAAMEGASDQALGLAADLQPVVDRLQEIDRSDPGFWTDFVTGVQGAASAIPGLGLPLGAVGVDVTDMIDRVSDIMPTLKKIGIDSFELSQSIAGSFPIYEVLNAALKAGTITAEEYAAAVAGIAAEEKRLQDLREDDKFFDVGIEQLKAMQDAADKASDPLDHYKEQWDVLRADLRDGRWDTQASADALNTLSLALGLTADEVRAIAWDEYVDGQKSAKEATEEATKAVAEWVKALQDAAIEAAVAVADAQLAVNDMDSAFTTMARNSDAIAGAFALGNAPLEALEAVVDVNEAIRTLGEFIRDEGVPDIFDPNDVDAEPFLSKIEGLRTPIQQAITNAFATGGPVAATATADAYVKQIVASMRGKLTEDQVRTLLGLDDLEATLKIAVDQSSLALAKESLEVLVGLKGESPWTASIALALASGEITPQAAQALINEKLAGAGVEIPAALGPVANTATVQRDTQRELNRNPLTIPVKLVRGAGGLVYYDQGGVANGVGGIAGERGPEILDGKYLTAGPTYVPPGTRVMSRRQTRVVLNRNGGRNLRRYDSGGVVPMGPVTVNVNAAVVGNRYDTARAVARGLHDIQRLRGTRA